MNTNKIKFCPLSSGSKGNCIFIKYNDTRIIIDLGISCKRLSEKLSEIGESIDDIDAVFITHEHNDHISGCDVLHRKHRIPLYATERVWEHFVRQNKVKEVKEYDKNVVFHQEPTYINDLIVVPFKVPHDARCTSGYMIYAGGINGYKITVATDIGHITDELVTSLKNTNLLLIESNHDVEMLKNGKYPNALKRRVIGRFGHLSNDECGDLLNTIYHDDLQYVYLGHLSEENNRPMIAYDTVSTILSNNDIIIGQNLNLYIAESLATSHILEINID